MLAKIEGTARIVGDDINTDYIITSTRKRDSLDETVLKRYLLESVDPGFAASVRPTDLLVAGRNFGCGSAMEVAATVILAAGIRAVIARSFARSFYRNAINNGLVPVECDTGSIGEGHHLRVTIASEDAEVFDLTSGQRLIATPFPPVMRDLLEAGGLVPYIRRFGGFRRDASRT